jgi:hypothetical protein
MIHAKIIKFMIIKSNINPAYDDKINGKIISLQEIKDSSYKNSTKNKTKKKPSKLDLILAKVEALEPLIGKVEALEPLVAKVDSIDKRLANVENRLSNVEGVLVRNNLK